MTPDEVHDFLGREFPQLVPMPRRNPDGWSFMYGDKHAGVRRIVRVIRSSRESETKLLLSISNHLGMENVERHFDGGEDELRRLVSEEIRLYLDHFGEKME